MQQNMKQFGFNENLLRTLPIINIEYIKALLHSLSSEDLQVFYKQGLIKPCNTPAARTRPALFSFSSLPFHRPVQLASLFHPSPRCSCRYGHFLFLFHFTLTVLNLLKMVQRLPPLQKWTLHLGVFTVLPRKQIQGPASRSHGLAFSLVSTTHFSLAVGSACWGCHCFPLLPEEIFPLLEISPSCQ